MVPPKGIEPFYSGLQPVPNPSQAKAALIQVLNFKLLNRVLNINIALTPSFKITVEFDFHELVIFICLLTNPLTNHAYRYH